MSPTLQLLPPAEGLARQAAHEELVAGYADPYLLRRSSGHKHPVEDFLFTYYNHKPGQLRRWHPGTGVVLTGQQAAERQQWKYYRPLSASERETLAIRPNESAVVVDTDRFLRERRETVGFTELLLSRTTDRTAQFGCFGLHEWAMVYGQGPDDVRHEYLQLRLGTKGTDAVVAKNRIRCTHFDAFRFYTPKAVPLNELTPTRDNQRDLEQPGCLHANMDLYKWAYKLSPTLPSELVMACFELSWRIRAMDMQASPYDLADWGYPPIPIETATGKANYVALQRAFSAESAQLRERLLAAIQSLSAPVPVDPATH
ncbi:MAG: 3-methyladenine glycosylase [Micrococcaceae bacterium]|nr:3-methyladenine glycosylase [Micrococcaceae bacterium]